MALVKKLRKAKKEAPAGEKPTPVRTHLRNMIIVPEMIGSIISVYNGKTFTQVGCIYGGVGLAGRRVCQQSGRKDGRPPRGRARTRVRQQRGCPLAVALAPAPQPCTSCAQVAALAWSQSRPAGAGRRKDVGIAPDASQRQMQRPKLYRERAVTRAASNVQRQASQ